MTDDSFETQIRESLSAASRSVQDTPPPELPDATVAQRARPSAIGRPLLVACAVVLVAAVGVVFAGGTDDSVHTVGPANSGAGTVAEPPGGAQLMAALESRPGQVHELWAYRDDQGSCVVRTLEADQLRHLEGTDCTRPVECLDPSWTDFVSHPESAGTPTDCGATPPTFFDGPPPDADGGWEFVLGGLSTRAEDSGPDTPVLVSSRLDQRVATWEVQMRDGTSIGPSAVSRHPDGDRSYLFALVPGGWSGFEIVLRDGEGRVLGRLPFNSE